MAYNNRGEDKGKWMVKGGKLCADCDYSWRPWCRNFYQSPTNPKNLEKFEPLFTYVEEHLNKFMDHLGCNKPALKYAGGGLWVNINGRGHYNKPHNHPETHFSGIYYVEVPEHSGALYFQRRQMQSFQIEALCGDKNPTTRSCGMIDSPYILLQLKI